MTASQSAWMYQGVAVQSSVVLEEAAAWYCSASGKGVMRKIDRFHEPTVMSCSVPICESAMQNADIHPCRLFSNATKCQLFEISPFGPVFVQSRGRCLDRYAAHTNASIKQRRTPAMRRKRYDGMGTGGVKGNVSGAGHRIWEAPMAQERQKGLGDWLRVACGFGSNCTPRDCRSTAGPRSNV